MNQKVRGIVLDSFKFKETSLICHTYSREHGLMSILVSGIGKKKSGITQIYFQNLNIIDFTIRHKEGRGIQRASEINLIYSCIGLVPDVRKYAIAFFISEVILKACKEGEEDKILYSFIENTIFSFDQNHFTDLYLYFIIHLIIHLGFAIDESVYNDSKMELSTNYQMIKNVIFQVSSSEKYNPLGISKQERSSILKFLLKYLEQNIGISSFRSIGILESLFSF